MPAPVSLTPDEDSHQRPNVSLLGLFTAFLTIGVLGFGGIAAIAYHVLVERRRWLSPKEFTEIFGVCSILPGGNILNATVMLGDRYQGVLGVGVGLSALLAAPIALLLLVVTTYDAFAGLPDVQAGMVGAASAAAGLIFGTAARLAQGAERTAASLLVALATFVAVGVVRLPLWAAVGLVAPISIVWSLHAARRR